MGFFFYILLLRVLNTKVFHHHGKQNSLHYCELACVCDKVAAGL